MTPERGSGGVDNPMHSPQPSATLPHRGTRYRRVGLERVRDRLGRGVRGGATRWLRPAGAALLGVAVGVGVALALQGPPDPPPAGSAPVATRAPEAVRAAAPMPTGPVAAAPATSAAPADRVLLAWTPGRLPGGLAGRVGRVRGVRAVTVVRGGLLGLAGSVDAEGRPVDRPRPGTTVPLETIGFDPATYPGLLPASASAAFARLRPGEALLGATSARLRHLGPGGRLRVAPGPGQGGTRRWLTIAGVVDDDLVGAAEVAVTTAGARAAGITRDRYLLLAYRGGRDAVAGAVRRILPARLPVRLLEPAADPQRRWGLAPRLGCGGRPQRGRQPDRPRLGPGPAPGRGHGALGVHLGRPLAGPGPGPLRVAAPPA